MPNARKPRAHSLKRVVTSLFAVLLITGLVPASLMAASTDVNVKVCYPVPVAPPTITSPPDGFTTTDSSVILSGEAVPEAPVYVFRNNTEIGYVSAGVDGQYTASVSIAVGGNELKTSVRDDCDDDSFSEPITVVREAIEPPPGPGNPPPAPVEQPSADGPEASSDEEVEQQPGEIPQNENQPEIRKPQVKKPLKPGSRPIIIEPKHGEHFTDPGIIVTGHATANTEVRIYRNGKIVARVVSDDKGVFVASIILQARDNDLMAVTGQGKELRKSDIVKVTYGEETKIAGFIPPWTVPVVVTTAVVAAASALIYAFAASPHMSPKIRRFLKRLRLP